MKIFSPTSWISRSLSVSLIGTVLLTAPLYAQKSAQKFDPNNFPGFVMAEVVVPVPSEIFSVLDKLGEPNWKQEVLPLQIPNTSDRAELSLLFGMVVAEGFIAVQAEDKQAVENIGREVKNLAARLGLSKPVGRHAQSILDSVQKNDWKSVRREFDQTQATVRSEMERMRDNDLAQCVSLGGWLRGTAAVTSVIVKNFSTDRSELLNQPTLVDHFIHAVGVMPQQSKSNPKIQAISQGLTQIRNDMNAPKGVFSLERTQSIRKTSNELLAIITQNR